MAHNLHWQARRYRNGARKIPKARRTLILQDPHSRISCQERQTATALTFVSLAFRSLDWVQVIHEGLIFEKRGRGKINEEIYFQQSVPLAGGLAYCTT